MRGELRIYAGAAAGVGTTYAMLDEGIRRRDRGADVMVGCVETHQRPNTTRQLVALTGSGDGSALLDLEDVLRRRPAVVLVDELAVDNPSGSAYRHRWQEVEAIIEAGIDVITTLSVQQIDSLADPVRQIVGMVPSARVPDEFLRHAGQIELIDITPEAIRRRIAHGNVFGPDELDPQRADLFNSPAFAELRALLLFWLADRLTAGPDDPREARERVVVAVTDGPGGEIVIRRAARLAQRSRARLVGVHVRRPGDVGLSAQLAARRALVGDVGGRYHELEGADVAATLVAFAGTERATQLVLGTSGQGRLATIRGGSIINQVIRRAGRIDVHVISHAAHSGHRIDWASTTRPSVSRRRRNAGFAIGAVWLAVLTAVLVADRDTISLATALSLYLLSVVSVTALGGRAPGVISAVVAPILINWYLIPPYHTLRIKDGENIVSLVVFVSVAIIVSGMVSLAAGWAEEARRSRDEAETLAALAGSGGIDPLASITEQLQQSFRLDGVSVLRVDEGTGLYEVAAASGANPPTTPDEAMFHETIGAGVVLAASGRMLTADDHRVLRAFVGQLSRALDQHRLSAVAARADALGQADALRTSMLRAVSHDLRTPLAGIKAAVSSLRQRDVEWPPHVRDDFLAGIEDETDRLTSIVTNLLDLSRLQAGALQPMVRAISLEEVVPAALHSLGHRADGVELDLPPDLADVVADPALLERVVANLIANAVAWSPPDRRVRLSAHQRAGDVQVHIIDQGPGIRPKDRAMVMQPFHRLGDQTTQSGLGLGLAIANGLTAAMGCGLDLRDTPRGGLTVVVTVPRRSGIPA